MFFVSVVKNYAPKNLPHVLVVSHRPFKSFESGHNYPKNERYPEPTRAHNDNERPTHAESSDFYCY